MKKFTKIFVAVAALSLLFSSCVREKIEVGEPENDSYGVYFETLSAASLLSNLTLRMRLS